MRINYQVSAAGAIELFVDGRRARKAVSRPYKRSTAKEMAELLDAAAALGAAYGPRDLYREMAATLDHSFVPGCATFYMRPDNSIGVWFDGEDHALAMRPVKPGYVWGEFCNELGVAFDLGGKYRRSRPALPV